MTEEKKEKEDCPLCNVSEETIKRLKEQEKSNKKEKSNRDTKKKSPWKFRIIFLIIILVLTGFIFYEIFVQAFPEFKIEKRGGILSMLSNNVEVGDPAPDFVSEDVFGNRIALSDFKDNKPVLLVFWATWCGYCAKELPDLKNFAKDYKDKIEVIVITSGEEKEAIEKYIQENNIDFLILLDENREIWNEYPVRGTPAHFLIDSQGKIVGLRPGLASREDLEIMMTMLVEFW